MENSKEEKQLGILLAEAADMLEDVRSTFGLFQKKRHYRFRSALDAFIKNLQRTNPEEDGR